MVKKQLSQVDEYLINKAWSLRGINQFDDLETAKLIIKGKIHV